MTHPAGIRPVRLVWRDALLGSPLRQFQVVLLTSMAVAFWIFGIVDVLSLPREGVEGTLADLAAGALGDRWHSFLVALLVWAHVPLLLALWCWGAVLAARSAVAEWRGPDAGTGASGAVGRLPAGFVGWGALAVGMLAHSAASLMPGHALLWDEHYGLTQWVALLWWAVALAMLAVVLAGAVRRRRQRLERERRREAGRVAAAERRAAAKAAKRQGRGR
ncbi:hypothetical protein AA0Y32_08735 [Georgenia phoenicis]|uniref:hypothetical protein n=1 Tax=unclassified Georgenia TaxID=2626815 RepID=UPI0039AEFB9E